MPSGRLFQLSEAYADIVLESAPDPAEMAVIAVGRKKREWWGKERPRGINQSAAPISSFPQKATGQGGGRVA